MGESMQIKIQMLLLFLMINSNLVLTKVNTIQNTMVKKVHWSKRLLRKIQWNHSQAIKDSPEVRN